MKKKDAIVSIQSAATALGIEFGSTRIKAVLIDKENQVLALGSHIWENRFDNGYWTYRQEDIILGLQKAYSSLKESVRQAYHIELEQIGSIGISAMMHGYIVLDEEDHFLVPFRTWRNSTTAQAAQILTQMFDYSIPLRWSIAHLYQANLNKEKHIPHIKKITTLAGYIHYLLTGEHILGIGDASGMFPIDKDKKNYDERRILQFHDLIKDEQVPWKIQEILPDIRCAGNQAGTLHQKEASLLDPSGTLKEGASFCPPEGDAGTGMIATNSIRKRTGNVSAGTSIFAMVVLEEKLKECHPEIDLVTTPTGELVAMVHANNCSSEINRWANLFKEFLEESGLSLPTDTIYQTLFEVALKGDTSKDELLIYPYHSGEDLLQLENGSPLLVRSGVRLFVNKD